MTCLVFVGLVVATVLLVAFTWNVYARQREKLSTLFFAWAAYVVVTVQLANSKRIDSAISSVNVPAPLGEVVVFAVLIFLIVLLPIGILKLIRYRRPSERQ